MEGYGESIRYTNIDTSINTGIGIERDIACHTRGSWSELAWIEEIKVDKVRESRSAQCIKTSCEIRPQNKETKIGQTIVDKENAFTALPSPFPKSRLRRLTQIQAD